MEQQTLRYAAMFTALGHEARLEIVQLLLTAGADGMVVGDIQSKLDIPASTLSHHLETLRREQLIDQEREGRFLRYRAGNDSLRELIGFLYAECCGGRATIELFPAGSR